MKKPENFRWTPIKVARATGVDGWLNDSNGTICCSVRGYNVFLNGKTPDSKFCVITYKPPDADLEALIRSLQDATDDYLAWRASRQFAIRETYGE